jgi:hypothetical protein
MSKKTGYCMGLRVSDRPGSRMLRGAFEDIVAPKNSCFAEADGKNPIRLGLVYFYCCGMPRLKPWLT